MARHCTKHNYFVTLANDDMGHGLLLFLQIIVIVAHDCNGLLISAKTFIPILSLSVGSDGGFRHIGHRSIR